LPWFNLVLALQHLKMPRKLRKRSKTSITGAILRKTIASFVVRFADSNGNHFVVLVSGYFNVGGPGC